MSKAGWIWETGEMAFELFKQPHPHPMIFIEEGTNGQEDMLCSHCNKALNPPAFACLPCKFYLHQSCVELPPQIDSRFHPQHPLFLANTNYGQCNCCGQEPRDFIYTCSHCNFIIDIKCALADTTKSGLNRMSGEKYQHFNDKHPLTLVQEQENMSGKKLVVCHICELLIASAPIYYCSVCDIRFHKGCAELPREMLHPDRHPHPLFLFPPRAQHSPDSFCDSCKNRCAWFVYSCLQCNFHLHVTCLLSSNHDHNFAKLRNQIEFRCLLCGGWRKNEFPWFCSICHLLAHKECAELPSDLWVIGHYHSPLDLTYSHPRVDHPRKVLACEICREKIEMQFAAYSCSSSTCKYVVHLNCARRKMLGEVGDLLFNGIDMKDGTLDIQTLHSNCQHALSLCNEEDDKYCHGCMRRISAQSYNCANCDFFLHKVCAASQITKHHLLHKHPLTLITTPDVVFQCNACLQFCHGYAYHCEECRFTLDIRCARIPTKQFKHSSHPHFLSLAQNNEDHTCSGCGQSNNTVFRCDDGCNFSLDYRCATLPLAVKCRSDIHSLNLTFIKEDETGEYYCDVCEEERNPNVCFYYCKMCCFAAHPACVLGEYPWLKSGLYEAHRHLLALVTEGKRNYSACGHCGKSCAGNLAYECGRCKFNVHAIGRCYHEQILKGKITFKK